MRPFGPAKETIIKGDGGNKCQPKGNLYLVCEVALWSKRLIRKYSYILIKWIENYPSVPLVFTEYELYLLKKYPHLAEKLDPDYHPFK